MRDQCFWSRTEGVTKNRLTGGKKWSRREEGAIDAIWQREPLCCRDPRWGCAARPGLRSTTFVDDPQASSVTACASTSCVIAVSNATLVAFAMPRTRSCVIPIRRALAFESSHRLARAR